MKISGPYVFVLICWLISACSNSDANQTDANQIDSATYVSQPTTTQVGDVQIEPYHLRPAISITFDSEQEIVSTIHHIYTRPLDSDEDLTLHPYEFYRLHKTLYNPFDSLYYVTEGDEFNVLIFKHLNDSLPMMRVDSLAGEKFLVPHDLALDTTTGWMYLIDANNARLFRFKSRGADAEVMSLPPAEGGYARSISMVDGNILIGICNKGQIMEVTSFEEETWRIHDSPNPKKAALTGSWEQNGLIPIDIEKYKGWYYLTNAYTRSADSSATNISQNKLIRFKSWEDLEAGTWEDLHTGLDTVGMPYNLTKYNGSLYLCGFSNDPNNWHTWIYKIDDLGTE